MGVLLAVIERAASGEGQIVDAAMVDGANYVALPLFKWMQVRTRHPPPRAAFGRPRAHDLAPPPRRRASSRSMRTATSTPISSSWPR